MTITTQKMKNNSQTDYFKILSNNEQKNEENKLFDLVLVDIWDTLDKDDIKCVKKNMCDPKLKYICISYRWGELNEQQLETPDYTAHITSFYLNDLHLLCYYIQSEPDLCKIDYLWIDAISVDQQNHSRKKDTILKMNQIYQNATYILAVPDLHHTYLLKHPANNEIIDLIDEYKKTIYSEIFNNKELDISTDNINSSITTNLTQQNQQINNDDPYLFIQKLKNANVFNEDIIKKMEGLETEIKGLKIKNKKMEMEIKEIKTENKNKRIKDYKKRIYQYLAYLIEDWSNRAWVISEYQIAKAKYKKNKTPLKYIFISLYSLNEFFFFYHFDDDDQQSTINNKVLDYNNVNDPILFNQFVKSRFMQRPHLDMILNSNTTQNEDRFNAILPSWNKYSHLIKNVSHWKISDMTSVRLKLYEIMDDLWEKATLLLACRKGSIFPTYASNYKMDDLKIIEKMNHDNVAYKQFEESLLEYICNDVGDIEEAIEIRQLMDVYKMYSKSIWNENLTSIQFEPQHCYLSVKSNSYFIRDEDPYLRYKYQNKLLDDYEDEIYCVFIPFFTFDLPDYIDYIPIYEKSSGIFLVGNKKENKWLLADDISSNYKPNYFFSDDYTFNIY